MSSSISLSGFLRNDETQIRFFDIGRRVTKLQLADFEKFEQRLLAYPYPFQQTAWVGILFWNIKNKEQHNIWFVRMPLDEQGFINIASRDEFMDMLLARIGEQIVSKDGDENKLTHALKDNPYVFKPTEENMAAFHSKAKHVLGLPASQFLKDMIQYLSGENFENWQNLGIQGFADIAIKQSEPEVQKLLCRVISELPEQPFCALCNALENETCGAELSAEIVKILRELISEDANGNVDESKKAESLSKITSCIRAIANTASTQLKQKILSDLLLSQYGNEPAVLVMIAAKNWESLDDKDLLRLYLEKLSSNPNGSVLFNALMADQMFMPGKRNTILEIFRDPDRSDVLSTAVGAFFNQMNNNS